MFNPPRHENGGIFDRGEEAQKKAPSKRRGFYRFNTASAVTL
jgi:hypothetical protein